MRRLPVSIEVLTIPGCGSAAATVRMVRDVRTRWPRELRCRTCVSAPPAPAAVRPLALQALREIGIDTSSQSSKSTDGIDAASVDAVVALCAEEVCPLFLEKAPHVHWPLPDVAKAAGGDAHQLAAYREVRDDPFRRLKLLLSD